MYNTHTSTKPTTVAQTARSDAVGAFGESFPNEADSPACTSVPTAIEKKSASPARSPAPLIPGSRGVPSERNRASVARQTGPLADTDTAHSRARLWEGRRTDQPAPDNSKNKRHLSKQHVFCARKRSRQCHNSALAPPDRHARPRRGRRLVRDRVSRRVSARRSRRFRPRGRVRSGSPVRGSRFLFLGCPRARPSAAQARRPRRALARGRRARVRAHRGLLDAHHEARGEPALHRGGLRRDRRGAPPGERAEARHRRCHLRGTGDPHPRDGWQPREDRAHPCQSHRRQGAGDRARRRRARQEGWEQGGGRQETRQGARLCRAPRWS
jgi:hypothetical protein